MLNTKIQVIRYVLKRIITEGEWNIRFEKNKLKQLNLQL